MKFKRGQEVTPNKKTFKQVYGKKRMLPWELPVFGKIYTVAGYIHEPFNGDFYMFLNEMEGAVTYNENGFSPVITDEELSEALKTEELCVSK